MKPSFLTSHKLSKPMKNYKVIPTLIYRSLVGNRNSKIPLPEEDIEYLEKTTSVNKAQIDTQYQIFLTNHPDGQISKKCFRSMLADCYPSADTNRVSKHIWRMYDTNLDGFIDFREFMIVLYVMSNGSPEENLRQIFRVFDIDNDGKINPEEMKRIVKDLLRVDDGNQNNMDNMNKDALARSAFSEMDENEDGEISQEEFTNACLAQKKFSSMLAMKIIDIFIEK
eukprot:GFUD01002451.1.p1 GENE.GFUD01002451.1~~GFUD01002451.1.p1  ORF type:complete len:225 (-),score=61.66 GFUD01002451.1:130-804(-)